jgi:hypothetical protein
MLPLFLACGIWLVAFATAIVGLVVTGSGAPNQTGTIVLDHKPFCVSFVVETKQGFALLDWVDGDLAFGETDSIVGPLHTGGLQSFDVAGRGMLKARVSSQMSDLPRAEQAFRERCGIDRSTPLEAASKR